MRPQDLLDRLAAGYEYDPMYGALCNERDQLKAENAKLREYAAKAWSLFIRHGAVHTCDLSEVDAVRDGLSELGIELGLKGYA